MSSGDWFVSGSDIWGTADSFFYVYQPLRDGSISTTVFAETGTHPFAKAGVMIRQTLDPGSPEVVVDVKPDGGIEFMTRAAQGDETTFVAGGSVPQLFFNATLTLTRMDVGVVGLPGHATYEDATGTFLISGAGSDIWGPLDSFYAVSRTLTGDPVLTARIVSEQNTDPFAKAGLIMGDAATNARRVILDVKPDGGIEFMARTDDGTLMSFVAGASASFPYG